MAQVKRTTQAQRFFGQFELARLQFTKAENALASAKERARLAKRKRKEAKLAARLARKAVKRAKKELSEAREAMATAEAKLAQVAKQRARKKAKTPPGKAAKTGQPGLRGAQSAKKPQPFRRRASVLAESGEAGPKAETTQQLSSSQAPATTQSMGSSTVESAGL